MFFFTLQFGKTALHYAAKNGHNTVCSQLVEAEATVDLTDVVSGNVYIHLCHPFRFKECAGNGHGETLLLSHK